MGTLDNSDTSSSSLTTRFDQAVALIESDPERAVEQLTVLQKAVAGASLFSSNESLDDISTSTVPLLGLDHCLALAHVQIPSGVVATVRQFHLRHACELWHAFLDRLDKLEVLQPDELSSSDNGDTFNDNSTLPSRLPPPMSRQVKIDRYRAQLAAADAASHWRALQERRRRMGVAATDQVDGHDDESLARALYLTVLTELQKLQALEAWGSVLQELPLVERRVQAQAGEAAEESRYHDRGSSRKSESSISKEATFGISNKPLQVTQITKDAATGQLRVARQEIQSKVFRAGWNQPTMSLEQLADREVAGAIEREARQKVSEAEQALAPRRYEQLVKDGLDDDADLVDASADLDRQWDAFKDENPRGSGNKRGDVGDRNF
jgi:immunoglobulin-binding protein 1